MVKVESETAQYMKMDTDNDGLISFEEFYNFHLKLNGLGITENKNGEIFTLRFTENLENRDN